MTFADLRKLLLSPHWVTQANTLTAELIQKTNMDDKKEFIEAQRDNTWAHPDLLASLKRVLGYKCWYSELPLEGHDPDVDHFRPKGRVREIDEIDKSLKGEWDGGYWWLAFEHRNFRLSSQHANQRRVDQRGGTDGGKSDYFPVDGTRCTNVTDYDLIQEQTLALDPCSPTDVALLRFNSDGKPEVRKGPNGLADPLEERRVKFSIWLFHLDKNDIVTRRKIHMEQVMQEFRNADWDYRNWKAGATVSKASFDRRIIAIRDHLKDEAPLAGAARSMKRLLAAEFAWIDDYL